MSTVGFLGLGRMGAPMASRLVAQGERLLVHDIFEEAVAALVGLLVVAMLLPLAGPVILARFVDDALAGRPVGALTVLALAYLVVAVRLPVFRRIGAFVLGPVVLSLVLIAVSFVVLLVLRDRWMGGSRPAQTGTVALA